MAQGIVELTGHPQPFLAGLPALLLFPDPGGRGRPLPPDAHGLARASEEQVGQRSRTVYAITVNGRRALAAKGVAAGGFLGIFALLEREESRPAAGRPPKAPCRSRAIQKRPPGGI